MLDALKKQLKTLKGVRLSMAGDNHYRLSLPSDDGFRSIIIVDELNIQFTIERLLAADEHSIYCRAIYLGNCWSIWGKASERAKTIEFLNPNTLAGWPN